MGARHLSLFKQKRMQLVRLCPEDYGDGRSQMYASSDHDGPIPHAGDQTGLQRTRQDKNQTGVRPPDTGVGRELDRMRPRFDNKLLIIETNDFNRRNTSTQNIRNHQSPRRGENDAYREVPPFRRRYLRGRRRHRTRYAARQLPTGWRSRSSAASRWQLR